MGTVIVDFSFGEYFTAMTILKKIITHKEFRVSIWPIPEI